MQLKKTAGRWDPAEPPIYFVAADVNSLIHASGVHEYLLIALNAIKGEGALKRLEDLLNLGVTVFLDSGVFELANEHAKAHGISHDEALGLAPDKIDGFRELYRLYVKVAKRFGKRLWGYIEIDQGGHSNKVKTRAKLERAGLMPIPVYHPLLDGWDYFDELAQKYDRICFGNIVQADPETRKRLVATAWERRRRYPHLWIHGLGMTVCELSNAFPFSSCDSSTWLNLVRWPDSFKAKTACKPLWHVEGMSYNLLSKPDASDGSMKARTIGGYEASSMMRQHRDLLAAYRESLGCDARMTKTP